VGLVLPAETVVTEGEARDQTNHHQHKHGEVVASSFHRAPERQFDARSRDG
jgi:hypothetical protein